MRTVGDDDGQRSVGHRYQTAPHGDVRGAVVGALTAAAAALVEKVHPEAICVAPDGVSDAVVNGRASAAAALQLRPAAQDVAPDNFAEGLPELSDAVGVDEGVDDGVAVGQDDGRVHDE